MIKTFRGILADGGQDKIRLSTKKGKIGYRIIKFSLFPQGVGNVTQESVVTVMKVATASVPTSLATTDLTDQNILAVGAFTVGSGVGSYQTSPAYNYVIFDQEIFNQDIFIIHTDNNGASDINYYLELEVVNLTDNAASVSTLRDIRLNPQVGA